MAVQTAAAYNSNVADNIAWDGNIFGMHTVAKYAIGTRLCRGDKVYRYGHFGLDTVMGRLVSQDISESSVVDTADIVVAPASAATTTDGTLGQKFLEITLASVTADMFAGGTLHITDDTGAGYTYNIKGNTATDDPASGNFRMELYDNIQVAFDATTDIAITGNMYANLEYATATDFAVAGVSCSNMDVSVASYGWVQTWGPCSVLVEGTPAAGSMITVDDGESTGAAQVAGGAATSYISDLISENIIGYTIHAGDDGEYGVEYLMIAP